MTQIVIDERLDDHDGDVLRAANDAWLALVAKANQLGWGRVRWDTARYSLRLDPFTYGRRVRLEVQVRP